MHHNTGTSLASVIRFFSTATVIFAVVSLVGCNEEEETVDSPKKQPENAKTNAKADSQDDIAAANPNPVPIPRPELNNDDDKPEAKPATPQAAVLAALDDAKGKLSNADIKGFIEHYMPLERIMFLRNDDGITREAARMAGDIKMLNALIKVLDRASKGRVEIDESGYIATVFLPAPDPSEVPATPSKEIKVPELTNAKLTGYGDDFSKVVESAVTTLKAGDTQKFVNNMFPASELRHPDWAKRWELLEARLKANPAMVEQMKTDFEAIQASLADGAPSVKKTDDKTQVVTLAGSTVEQGRSSYQTPERTFKFQLVEGSWRLFDNSTNIRKEIARQSTLSPPDLDLDPIKGDYIQLQRLADRWRLGKMKVKSLQP